MCGRTGNVPHEDQGRTPLSGLPEHLRGSRQHSRALAPRFLARSRARRRGAVVGRRRPARRARPALHRRRPGSRAVARGGRSCREGGCGARGGCSRRCGARRLRRLPVARALLPRSRRRRATRHRSLPAAHGRRRTPDDRRRPARLRLGGPYARGLREPRRPHTARRECAAARSCHPRVRQRRRERLRGLPRRAGDRHIPPRAAAAAQSVARRLVALASARARVGSRASRARAARRRARDRSAPARSGDVLKLFLVKRRVEGSTYPTLGATLVVETLFDAFVGIALLVWAAYLGVLPNIHKLPRLPNIDLRWAFQHPLAIEIGALALGILIGLLLVWATARVRAFWARVRQGFAVLDDRGEYVRTVVTWQALSWVLRLATIYFMLQAFHLPATLHNALLVQIAQSLSTLLPITPGGAGTEQGLLLYLFRGKAARSSVLSFSVGMHIAIVVLNVALGVLAIALMTRSLGFRRLRRDAAADAAKASPPP